MKNFLVTINQWAHIPPGTVFRGSGKWDFYADTLPDANVVKERLKEVKENGTVDYAKAGEKTKVAAELKKEGKPIATDPIKVDPATEKDKEKPVAPVVPDDAGGKKP